MYDYLKALHARSTRSQNFKKSGRNWTKPTEKSTQG